MSEESQSLASLLEMGCDQYLCRASVRQCQNKDLGTLLDWIGDQAGNEEKWKKWLEQNPVQAKSQSKVEEEAQKGQSISQLVNQQMAQQLIQMGHTKIVAEKSLLLTNNASIESAVAWIDAHKYDTDFQEELFLEGQAYKESTLTDEQAKAKLKELTEKAREKRKKREQEEERQRQKNRVRYGKQMIEAKRIAEEQAMKRQLQLDRIQKKKDEEYKAKLLEQMRRERNQKLGIKQQEGAPTQKKVENQVKLDMLEQLQLQCKQVEVGMLAHPDKAKVFFQTAKIYIGNIIKNNGQQKFRKINQENKAFQARVTECFGGVQVLKVLGYQEEDNFLIMKKYNLGELSKALEILQKWIQTY